MGDDKGYRYDERYRCTATANSTGERCRRTAHPGTNVCLTHGASAPQVRRAARERLAALVDPAIDVMQRALREGDLGLALKAANSLLDRAGHPKASKVELEEAERRLTEGQADAIARICRDCLSRLGIPDDDPHVNRALRAALIAEAERSGYDVSGHEPPEPVRPLPEQAYLFLRRWWAGEGDEGAVQ